MVKIKGKIFKVGTGYAMTIPKALVESEVLKRGERLTVEVVDAVSRILSRTPFLFGLREEVRNDVI